MAALSKYFEQALAGARCRDLLHPDCTCQRFVLRQMGATVATNLRFFLPVSALRLLLLLAVPAAAGTRRPPLGHILRQTLLELGAMVADGWLVANSWIAIFCAMSNVFGRLYDNFSVSLPALLGTFAMFAMPSYVQTTHSKAIFNVFVECWVKSREHRLIVTLRESPAAGTALFMAISAGIVRYACRTQRAELWFVAPLRRPRKPEPEAGPVCYHPGSCPRYIVGGMRTCLTFGLMLELARRTIAALPLLQRDPVRGIRAIGRIRYKFVAFLALYSGTFRLITCLLGRHRRKVLERDNMVAAFLAGLWYRLSPNYNIFNLALAAMLQNLWGYLKQLHATSPLVQRLDRISLAAVVWIVLMNYNMYSRAYYPYAMSRYAMRFTDMCSNNVARTASESFARRFLVT